MCDPLARDCQHEGQECYFAHEEFFCAEPTDPMGATGEPGRLGDHCFMAQGCMGGLVCTPVDFDRDCQNPDCNGLDICGCCTALCDVELDPAEYHCDRDTEQVCRPLLENPPRGFEDIGACAVPPER